MDDELSSFLFQCSLFNKLHQSFNFLWPILWSKTLEQLKQSDIFPNVVRVSGTSLKCRLGIRLRFGSGELDAAGNSTAITVATYCIWIQLIIDTLTSAEVVNKEPTLILLKRQPAHFSFPLEPVSLFPARVGL
jgi:hypothetical protein